MKKNLKSTIVFGAVLVNLLMSASFSLADDASGIIGIDNCTINCFSLVTPSSLSFNGSKFIDNDSQDFYLYSRYDLDDKIGIKNAIEGTGFDLSVISSDLENTSNPDIKLPYSQIGILSFNNSPTESVDMTRVGTNTSIQSNIDPVVTGATIEPFDMTTIKDHIDAGDGISNYYTYFSGSGSESDSIDLISGPADNNSLGYFNVGLSSIIRLPSDSISNLGIRDGQYNLTLTFSLTSI